MQKDSNECNSCGTVPHPVAQWVTAKPVRWQRMSEELNRLIEMARKVDMSEADKEQQRISFAYGNTKIENDDITWDTVKKAAEDLKNR
jgi:hypothetical protein